MFRLKTSNTLINEATDAGIVTLKTLSMLVAICEGAWERRGSTS